MFEPFKRGWAMAKASLAVLKDQPILAVFPVISAAMAVVLTSLLAVPVFFGASAAAGAGVSDDALAGLGLGALLGCYFLCTFAVIFCNAALIACALQRFAGQPTSVRAGFAAAGRRLPQILGWTLVAGTVGVVLQAVQSVLRNKVGFLGDVVSGLGQGLWSVVTYFAVPVVVTEGLGPIAAVKRSSSLIRRMWGEYLSGSTGLGLIMVALLLPALALGGVLWGTTGESVATTTVGVACLIYAVILTVVFSALGSIFRAGVYTYATTGIAPDHLDAHLLQSTFRTA